MKIVSVMGVNFDYLEIFLVGNSQFLNNKR